MIDIGSQRSQMRRRSLWIGRALIFFAVWLFAGLGLFSQQKKVVVITEKAAVYAEPYARSYVIESIKKGTVLDLFQTSKVNDTWYYVRFQSRKYAGPAMGFVKDSQVELFSGDKPPVLKPQEKQAAPVPPPLPIKKTEPKEPLVKIEETPAETTTPSHLSIFLSSPADALDSEIWLSTRVEFTPTPLPFAQRLQTPAAPSQLKGKAWEIETPPPKLSIPAKEEKSPPEDIRETKAPGPSSPITFSEKIMLSQETDSYYIQLGYAGFSSFRSFEMEDPNRIVIDFYDLPENAGFERHRVNALGIENIRVGMFQSDIARVVFDLQKEIPPYRIEQTESGLKIQFWPPEPARIQPTETRTERETQPEPEPEKETEIHTEEALHATAISSSAVLIFEASRVPENERLFLEVSGRTIKTALPLRFPPDLPVYQNPIEETIWERIQVQAVQEAPSPKPKTLDLPQPEAKPPASKQPEPFHPSLITLGLGYGASKGGLGGHFQYNLGKSLAVHAGVGYYPTALIYSETDWVKNTLLYGAGIKYFLPLGTEQIRPYLNLQYGGFTVEAVQIIEGIWEYEFIYRNEQKALFGPQALIGGEIRIGRFGLNAAAGAAYALTDWEWLPQVLYFTFDIGFLFYLK